MVTALVALRTTLVLAGLGLLGVGLRVYRTREAAALRPFVVLVTVVGVLAVLDGLTVGNLAALSVVWLLAYLAIPMSFAWFVVEYYGLSPLASRASRLAFLTPAALGLLGGIHLVLSPVAQGAMAGATSGGPAGLSLLTVLAGFAEEAALYYATGTMLVGVVLLVRVVGRYDYLDRRLAALLSFVPVWPWLAYFATPGFAGLVELETLVGVTTAGYLLSLCAAVFAVSRGGLFEAAPAAGTLGPETVLADLDEAVVVVDGRGRVVRCNRTATDTFGTAGELAVGRPLTALLGSDLDELEAGGTVELDVDGGSRHFEATVSAVTDRFGREPGSAVVLRDVTGERLRAQRLAVLNRVLRHNLRNGMTTIRGRAAVIADRTDEHADSAESILSSADDLAELGERAHEIEEMMSVTPRTDREVTVATVAENVVDHYRRRDAEASLSVDAEASLSVDADGRILTRVLDNLVENALVHNDAPTPVVTVSARHDPADGVVRVSVADNGPGIPDHERAVIEAGDESPLEHGSGLGLWAVSWGVTRLGGTLSFAENHPTGTVATVALPASTPPHGTARAAEAD